MNDVYGMNRDAVIKQIQYLHTWGDVTIDGVQVGFNYFLDVLSSSWCSPNAVAFEDKYLRPLASAIENFRGAIKNICIDAVEAFNVTASSHGEKKIPNDYGDRAVVNDGSSYWTRLKSNWQGETIFNETLVRTALNNLILRKDEFAGALGSLRADIAIWDPSGEIISSFKARIKSRFDDVVTCLNSIISEINAAFETETSSIKYASNSAKEIIQSGNGSNLA